MPFEFRLPDIGEGLTEAEIVEWLVAEGDTVAANQSVVEVETAKTTVEIPSPHAGTVTHLIGAPGDTIEVGEILFVLDGDAKARGLDAGKLLSEIKAVGYDGFVDLAATHERTQSWL